MRARVIPLLLLVAAACSDGGAPTPSASGSGSPRPPSLIVLARNVQIGVGIQNAVRFGFVPDDPTARVIVTYPDSGAIVAGCGLADLDGKIEQREEPACFTELSSGVRHEMAVLSGLKAAAFWVQSGSQIRADVRIEFGEASRDLAFKLPSLPGIPNTSECRDNGCNPVIEVTPVKGGKFTASATWSGGSARLALLEGKILAKSFTATGIPYRIDAEQESPSAASIQAQMSAPAEYALVLDRNAASLTDITIRARWP